MCDEKTFVCLLKPLFRCCFLLSGEPQGKDGNQKIRDKCKQYLDRAEELQEYLVNKEVITDMTAQNIPFTNGSWKN